MKNANPPAVEATLPLNHANAPTPEATLRQAMVSACIRMNATDLNQGTAGNLSVRHSAGLLITPSGVAYDALTPDGIVDLAFDGTYHHPLQPSSEWRIHRDIYAAHPEAGAVVHLHSPYATALAIRRMGIPAVHYMVAAAGGNDIRCAEYQTFGTPALSQAVLQALDGRRACLMANHGMVAWGRDLERALWLAGEVEAIARQYVLCLQMGEPVTLSADEMAEVKERFKSYGPLREESGAP